MRRTAALYLAPLLALAGTGTAQAQSAPVEQEHAGPGEVVSLVSNDYERNSGRTFEAEIGAGHFYLSGERLREGYRRDCDARQCAAWYRAYHGDARFDLPVTSGLDLNVDYAIERARRGNLRAPLMTDGTGGTSQRASIGLDFGGQRLALTAFDQAGWGTASLADEVERRTNGEDRARRGAALEYSFDGTLGHSATQTSFALEQASSPSFGSETAALVRFKVAF